MYTNIWLRCMHNIHWNSHCIHNVHWKSKSVWAYTTRTYTEILLQCIHKVNNVHYRQCTLKFNNIVCTMYTDIRQHCIHNVHWNSTTLYAQCILKSDGIIYTMYTEIRQHCVHNVMYTEIRRQYIHNVHWNLTALYTQCTLKSNSIIYTMYTEFDNIVYTVYTEIRQHCTYTLQCTLELSNSTMHPPLTYPPPVHSDIIQPYERVQFNNWMKCLKTEHF